MKKLLVKDQFKRIDWFELLNFNISEDGVISEPDKFSLLDQVKVTNSEMNINQYAKKLSDQSPSVSTNPSNELMFKKKAEPYTRSNTELIRGPKSKYEQMPTY